MRDLSQRSVPRRAVSRRSLIKMFIAAGSGVSAAQLLAACSSVPAAPTQAPPVTTGPTQAPAPTPAVAPFQLAAPGVVVPPMTMPAPSGAASDQTLSYAHQSKLLYLDPAQESGYGRFIISLVWLPPFLLDDKMNLTPGTCNAYEVSSDGLSVEVTSPFIHSLKSPSTSFGPGTCRSVTMAASRSA